MCLLSTSKSINMLNPSKHPKIGRQCKMPQLTEKESTLRDADSQLHWKVLELDWNPGP